LREKTSILLKMVVQPAKLPNISQTTCKYLGQMMTEGFVVLGIIKTKIYKNYIQFKRLGINGLIDSVNKLW